MSYRTPENDAVSTQIAMPPERTAEAESGGAVSSMRLLGEHRKPINRDAVKILRRVSPATLKTEWTKQDEEAARWAGAISKCPRCGDRAYEHGWCFGCGKPLGIGDGERRSPNDQAQAPRI